MGNEINYTSNGDVDTPALDHWLAIGGGWRGVLVSSDSDAGFLAVAGVSMNGTFAVVHAPETEDGEDDYRPSKTEALSALNDHIASESAAILGAS